VYSNWGLGVIEGAIAKDGIVDGEATYKHIE
jgi:hypothetical protein